MRAAKAMEESSALYAALQELRDENTRLKNEVQALLRGQAETARRLLTAAPPPTIGDIESTLQSHR